MIKKDIETLDKINYGGIMFEQGRKEREAEIIEILENMKLLGHISKYALQDIKEQTKEGYDE